MTPEELGRLLKALGLSLPPTFILGGILGALIIANWSQCKIFISDILWHGPTSLFKGGRKFNVRFEIEGSINAFVKEFNSEMTHPLLRDCQLQWITEENQDSIIQPGKAIVRVSYSKDNHDLNFYNAAYSFVSTSLLYKAKPFINKLYGKAADLLMTKDLIRRRKREVLTIFNQRFKNEDEALKQVYFDLEAINKGGLFKLILLQELHFFGEEMGDNPPRKEHEDEAQLFINWLYEIATREQGEKTDLQFAGLNIKAAVLLVASQKTFNEQGVDAYIRRGIKNASSGYPITYILARGDIKSGIAIGVANRLVETGYFSFLTKKYFVSKNSQEEKARIVTCIPLKAETANMLNRAWEKIETKFNQSETMTVLIEAVLEKSITVDAYGLKLSISAEDLSNLAIAYLHKYFSPNMELEVSVKKLDRANDLILLSNKGTKTDPENYIRKTNDKISVELQAKVDKILSKENHELGIIVKFENGDTGYVGRGKATYSRFLPLSEKYKIGDSIKVIPDYFDINFANFNCKVSGLQEPWSHIEKYKIGAIVTCVVREVREQYITLEIEEGVEGRLLAEEVSWDTHLSQTTLVNRFNAGDRVDLKIVGIDERRKLLLLSSKRLTQNPIEKFFVENRDQVVPAKVTFILGTHALVTMNDGGIVGFLPIREVSWGYCSDIKEVLKIGETIGVKLLNVDQRHNTLTISLKLATRNEFDNFVRAKKINDIVEAKVIGFLGKTVELKIHFEGEYCVVGHIRFSEMSLNTYITQSTAPLFLEKDKVYKFGIKRMDETGKIVELSRKLYLKDNISRLSVSDLEYEAKIVGFKDGAPLVYCNDFEGALLTKSRGRNYKVGNAVKGYLSVANQNEVLMQIDAGQPQGLKK